jgi:LPXTG-motif cell wall-anchored protein
LLRHERKDTLMQRVVTFLLAAGLVFAVAAPALAAPPSSDPKTDAVDAAAWLGRQVNAAGFVPSAANPANPNLSVTVQAVTALAAAGVGRTQVDALLGYLGTHVDAVVVVGGADDPGALSNLILAVVAGGADPTSFGPAHVNLVSRLIASQQPSGLFGTSDPTYDGAFRQGLSLLALHAVGLANAAGGAWLANQQCADGSWTSFRSDISVPCPPVDLNTITGPDTNSTALAAIGLHVQGVNAPAVAGVAELESIRNAQGGWGFFSDSGQATDANSTGVVLTALRTINGAADPAGIDALLTLQAGCTADPADRGGLAYQPGPGGTIAPDLLATVQATPALAEVALPVTDAKISSTLPTPCAGAVTTTTATTSTTLAASGTTVATSGTTAPGSTVGTAAGNELPRTGSSSMPLALVAVFVIAIGLLLAGSTRRRRA